MATVHFRTNLSLAPGAEKERFVVLKVADDEMYKALSETHQLSLSTLARPGILLRSQNGVTSG